MYVYMYVLHCPGQASMGVCSSSTKNLRLGGYTMQSQLPVGTESICIVALPVLCQCQPDDGGKCCIMLEIGLTGSLVAKLPQCLSLAVREFQCRKLRTLRTRLWTGMCETLMPDVMVPQAYQNNRSYVHELSGSTFDSLCNI